MCAETDADGKTTSNVTWLAFQTSLSIAFSNCRVGFINSGSSRTAISEAMPIAGSGLNSISTYTYSPLSLSCSDNCYQCSSASQCTACVNITHSPFIYLYRGTCYQQCPSSTFLPANETTCTDCHPSCQTCVNSSELTSCTTCPQYYTFKSINVSNVTGVSVFKSICISVCGEGMTFNANTNQCEDCEVDCLFCMRANYCYFCREGASVVSPGSCDFTICESPCAKCEGSMSNCTACI